MSDIQLYLIQSGKNKDEAARLAQQTATKLETKQLKLLALIESIGEFINNDDAHLRSQSLAYLADVLSSIKIGTLGLQQRALLCDFVLSRIQDDTEGIGSCARALMALEERGKWDQETVQSIMKTLIESTRSLTNFKSQSERFSILQLLDLLVAKYRKAIDLLAQNENDGSEFARNFVSFFEGEKDPRNLMIVFSILLVPMTEWTLGTNTQDFFDAVFTYFPITFKQQPGDPFGISAQDLKDRLQTCVASNAEFAPYAFPALLDKLDSSSMNTKRDVINAIQACVTQYEPGTIKLYSVTLWDALKFEILSAQEDDLAQESLEALFLIAKKLEQGSEGALNAYLKPIIKECNEHFEDAPTKQSSAAGKILNAVSKSSPITADSIVKAVLPHLFSLFHASESISRRRGLVEIFIALIDAVLVASKDWQIRDADGVIVRDHAKDNALGAFTEDALKTLLPAVISAPKGEVSFRMFSIDALNGLMKIPQLLEVKDVGRIVEALSDIILQEPATSEAEIKDAAIAALIVSAQHYPSVVSEKVVPLFLAKLPDCPEPGIFTYETALEAFARLGTDAQIVDTILLRLKNKVLAAISQKAPPSYVLSLLTAILFVCSTGTLSTDEGVVRMSYYWDLAKPLLDQALGFGQSPEPLLASEATVDIIGRICNSIIRPQSSHAQNQVFAASELLFDSLHASQPTFDATSAGQQESKLGIIASLHLHAAFQRDVIEPEVSAKLLHTLSDISSDPALSPNVRNATLRHISLIVNKFISSVNLEQVLQQGKLDAVTLLDDSPRPSAHSNSLAIAITKGLVIQGKSQQVVGTYLDRLLSLLSSQEHGSRVARGLAALLAPDDLLSKENHCIISGLHKQRVFNIIVPSIKASMKQAEEAEKPNYLVVLAGILRWVPYAVIQPSLASISPLLLQSLDLQNSSYQDIKAATLKTLEAVLSHDASSVEDHTSSLVSRLLNCTLVGATSAEVRQSSLRCLTLLPTQFKLEKVVPYRQEVIKRLLSCLDDKKRAVRDAAVRCRKAWLSLDAGEED